MMNILSEWMNGSYLWFSLGFVLLILEFVVPGLVLVFFGLGALVTGLLLLLFPMGMTLQVFVFSVASVALLLALRKMSQPILYGRATGEADVNDMVGKRVYVTRAIDPPEEGRVECNGVEWKALSEEAIEEGGVVEIMSRRNLTLTVKRIN